MEVSALKYSGGIGLHGRSALLRLQSDERLIAYLRKGNAAAFEILVARYETRLLAFCRHLLGSREDAEDVLQEVMTAAFNAIIADERPINVRPWLYRIARNRSLNHLRRVRAIGVDSIDTHFAEHGASAADKVHEREEFRLLVGDIHELPETQKTALVLREMDALSYEQIAEAMETTVPSVKSLLVRARVSLAEAAEARLLSCEEVRIELGEAAEGLRRRHSPLVRRHLRNCERCSIFRTQLKHTNKALGALMPVGPLVILKKLAIFHLGHSAAGSSGATAAGSSAAGAGAAGAAGAGAVAGGGAFAGASGGFLSAGLGAIATKAAAGIAAAAIVTAGAVEANHVVLHHPHRTTVAAVTPASASPAQAAVVSPVGSYAERRSSQPVRASHHKPQMTSKAKAAAAAASQNAKTTAAAKTPQPAAMINTPVNTKVQPTGRNTTQTDPTVLPTPTTAPTSPPASGAPTTTSDPSSAPPTSPPPAAGQPSSPPSDGTPAGQPVTPVSTPPAPTPAPLPPVPTPKPDPPATPPPVTNPLTTTPTQTTPAPAATSTNSRLSARIARLARSAPHASWGAHGGA